MAHAELTTEEEDILIRLAMLQEITATLQDIHEVALDITGDTTDEL